MFLAQCTADPVIEEKQEMQKPEFLGETIEVFDLARKGIPQEKQQSTDIKSKKSKKQESNPLTKT